MREHYASVVVGVLGQWASGKTEAARTLIQYLGGQENVVFLTDRALFASQAIKHVLELRNSEVMVRVEKDGRRRLEAQSSSKLPLVLTRKK
mgnify:CR=1 FL=1